MDQNNIVKKMTLWLYTSPGNKNGRSPLALGKKTILFAFVFALVFCLVTGNLAIIGLYRLGQKQLNHLYETINAPVDTTVVYKVKLVTGENSITIENETLFQTIFNKDSISFQSLKRFLQAQNLPTDQLERQVLGEYSRLPVLPALTFDMIPTTAICENLGLKKPPPQQFKKMSEEDTKFYLVFDCIDHFRNRLKQDYSAPIRLIICFSGTIQWLTYIFSIFGCLLLFLRIYMSRLQKRLALTGRLHHSDDGSIWEQKPNGELPYLWKLDRLHPNILLPVIIVSAARHVLHKNLSFDEQKNVMRDEVAILRNKSESDFTLPEYLSSVASALGFLGTIVGIILAFGFTKALLGSSSSFEKLIAFDNITSALSTAFDTTAIGLVWSLTLNYLITVSKTSDANLFELLEKTSITNLKKV